MSDRSVRVVLSATVAGFTSAMEKAKASVTGLGKDMSKFGKQLQEHDQAIGTVSTGLMAMGAAGVAGLTMTAKAAMNWEQAWTGVLKTVDGTEKQLGTLEGALRSMASELPSSHKEIAAVAEAAGQLGVKVDDVADFTRVMIDMGVSTNLAAEEAATTLARFTNIMGTAVGDTRRLGDVIVRLGNNYATTEAEIAAMGLRLSGAGRIAKMSEADVLGFAAAMSSVGIEAEAGGTAMSLTWRQIGQAVEAGGAKLDVLARTANMTSEQFARAWREDAAGAVTAFVEGLGRVSKEGGNVNAVLDELKMKGIRQSDTLLRLAAAGSLTADALKMANQEWRTGGALAEEAGKFYATTEGQMLAAKNAIVDSAIEFGRVLLPAVAGVSKAIAEIAKAFGNLPGPVQAGLVWFTAFGSGAALLVGGLMKAVVAASNFSTALKTLNAAFPGVSGKLGGMAGKIGVAAAKFAALSAVTHLVGYAMDSGQHSIDQVAKSMDTLAHKATGVESANRQIADAMGRGRNALTTWGYDIETVGDAFTYLENASKNGSRAVNGFLDGVTGPLLGLKSTTGTVAAEFGKMDNALTQMSSGGSMQQAQAAFRKLSDEAVKNGASMEFVVEQFPKFKNELETVAEKLGVTGLSAQDYANWMRGEIPPAVSAAASANSELRDSLSETERAMLDAADAAAQQAAEIMGAADAALKASGTLLGYKQSVLDAEDAIKKNGKTLDTNTRKGIENQRALDGIANAAHAYAESLVKAGEDGSAAMEMARKDFIKNAQAAGLSKQAAIELADKYGLIPDEVLTEMVTVGLDKSKKEADDAARAMLDIPSQVVTSFFTPGSDKSKKQSDDVNKSVRNIPKSWAAQISAPGADTAKSKAKGAESAVRNIPKTWATSIRTTADLAAAHRAKNLVASIKSKVVTIVTKMQQQKAAGGPVGGWMGLAGGGWPRQMAGPVRGWGGPTEDRVPVTLSASEFVMREAAHKYYGTSLMYALNNMVIPKYRFGLASGGSPRFDGSGGYRGTYAAVSSSVGANAPTVLNPAEIGQAVAQALRGARLELSGVNVLSDMMSARLVLAMDRG